MLKEITKKLFLPVVLAAIAIFGFAGMRDTIVEHSFFDSPVYAATYIAMLAILLFVWLFGRKINPALEGAAPFFKKISICCVCVFLAEMCLFNFVSLYGGDSVIKVPNNQLLIDDMPVSDSEIYLKNASTITIVGEGSSVGCIEINFDGSDKNFKISARIKDENKSQKYTQVAATQAAASNKKARLTINPYGKLYAIEIKVTNIDEPLKLEGITLLSAKPFSFNHSRMFLLFVIILAIITIKEFGLMKITFDAKKVTHQVALWSLALLCASSCLYFKDFEAEDVEYPLENVAYADPFAQMYDSLEKDIPYLDIEVEEELFGIENVYDMSQREEAGAHYIWDRAFYNGKYYSYFGIAPTLTFWKPYMALCGKLPSLNTAHMFAAFISVFALFGVVLEFLKRYCPKVSAIMLFISLVSAVFMSGIPIALFFGDGYNIAPAFAIMYLLLTLLFGLAAANSKNSIFRCILLVISAVCFVLCIASRPTLAVGAILLIPAFVSMLRSSIYSIRTKLAGLVSFVFPIFIGFVLIGKYNAARFGSAIDFGMAYQLTVCDVSQKSLEPDSLPAAIFHYFLAPANLWSDFPFVSTRLINFENYGHHLYNEGTFGAFEFLPLLAGLCLMPVVLKRKCCSFEKKCVYIAGAAAMAFVAFFDFCYAGVNLRYMMDILPVLTLLSLAVLLECHSVADNNRVLSGPCNAFLAFSFVQAAVLLLFVGLSMDNVPFINENRELYYIIRDAVVFWR